MRKVLIALAAVAALVISIPLEASARHGVGGGGGRGGGWHGGGGGMRGLSAGRSFGRASFGGMRGFRTSGFRQLRAARLNGAYFRHAHFRGLGSHGGRFAHRAGFLAAAPLLYAPYSYYFSDFGYGYSDGCYELQPLLTPRGLIWQRTWVCY
jgi:hypothetical protein